MSDSWEQALQARFDSAVRDRVNDVVDQPSPHHPDHGGQQ